MVLVSFLEAIGIGAVLPFLFAVSNPEKIFNSQILAPVIRILDIQDPQGLLMPFTFFFVLTVISVCIFRIALLWAQAHLSRSMGVDLGCKVYENTLYQPYIFHLSRNSSEILAGTEKANSLADTLIFPCLTIISSIMILVAVTVAFIAVQPIVTVAVILFFGLIYASITAYTRQRININSQVIALEHSRVTKVVQEGLGGIRDVILDGSQSLYANIYKTAVSPMQVALAGNQVVGVSPRFAIEALGMASIAMLAYFLASANGSSSGLLDFMPLFGVIVLGAQRLLPVLQQIYFAYTTIMGNQASTEDALNLLGRPGLGSREAPLGSRVTFQASIKLENVSFRYNSHSPWVLERVTLEIPKGSRVGFIGVTGGGKSTLLDILMGFLPPTQGSFFIDDVSIGPENLRGWQAHVSHVPQAIFLSDSTIAENIALGIPVEDIDMGQVKEAARIAQISQTIEAWSSGYNTLVGERGLRLSGGQRQRIAIARALYKRREVIVFDEATSALDNETESILMQALGALDRNTTVLMSAHRLTTLKNCDLLVAVADGSIATKNVNL